MSIIKAVQLSRGIVLKGKVGIQVDTVIAHTIAQKRFSSGSLKWSVA